MSKVKEEQVVFGIGPTPDGTAIFFGMTDASWAYMHGGLTHGFDLKKLGLPIKIVIFRGKDHDAVNKTITEVMHAQGVPVLDERRKDFSI
jgi:hypothetical protein